MSDPRSYPSLWEHSSSICQDHKLVDNLEIENNRSCHTIACIYNVNLILGSLLHLSCGTLKASQITLILKAILNSTWPSKVDGDHTLSLEYLYSIN